jgi:hypothetical protein
MKKQEIARTIYGGEDQVEVQDTADSEIEEDELLTQEEFDALSEEDQELYLEAIEQLDELKKSTLQSYYKKSVDSGLKAQHRAMNSSMGGSDSEHKKNIADIDKRMSGQDAVTKRLGSKETMAMDKEQGVSRQKSPRHKPTKPNPKKYSEEVEQLDEIGDTPAGKKALGSYVKKRVKQLPAIEVNYQMAPDEGGPFGAKRIKKFKTKVNKGIGRAVDRLAKEEVEELDEVSQKTAVKAYSARLGREDDDTGNTKSMKTMDRIHKKYGAKGVMRAATAADKEHGIHSSDYTKKDFVGDYLSSKK